MAETIHILHVDDEPDFAELVADFLERENDQFTVETATSANDGLDKLAGTSFDCIVSDYDMPGLNGLELLKTVREEYPRLPFILYTGKGSEAVASEAITAGVTDYLQKESGTSQYALLANRIENAVEQRHTQQQRRRSDWQFDAIFEDPQMLVGILDPDGTLRKANQTAMTYIDADHEAVTGELFWDTPWWSDEIRSDVQEWVARATEGEYVDYTADLTGASGTQYSVEGTIRPVKMDGELTSLIVSARDITARRERERQLESHANAMEASIDGMALLDADETYTFVNQAHTDIYGYDDPDAFLGESWRMCYSTDEQERFEEEVLPELRNSGNWRGEAIGQRQDGTTFPQTMSLTMLDDGGMVCVVRDITDRKKREKELERNKSYLEHTADAIIVLGADGRIQYESPAVETILGYEPQGRSGELAFDNVHPDDRADLRARFERLLAESGEIEATEFRVRHKNGSWRWLEIRATQYPERPIDGVIVSGRDITDRKEREQELQRYETILEASGDPVYTLDPDGRFTFVNDALVDLTSYTEDELVDEHVSIVMDDDDVAAGETVIRDLLQSDDRTRGTFEMDIVTAEGEHIACETHLALLPSDDGFRGTTGIVRDITDRKQREQELIRYKETLDTLPDSVSIMDSSLDHDYVNQTLVDVSGIPREEFLGESIETLLDPVPPEAQEWIEAIERVVAGERAHARKTVLFPTDTGTRHVDTRVGRIESESGELLGVVNVFRDITERVEAQREIQRQNEHLENFARFVSHDLRNPLNVAAGSLDLARNECDSEQLDRAADAHERMRVLIDDLLTLAQQGATIQEVESVDLALLTETSWQTVETGAASLNSTAEQTIRADESRVQELVENLFRNAVDHAGADVTVTVGDLADGQGFYVADDGPGIPEDERDAVFEAGYSTADTGTGFGLTIVQEIADAHGWEISITESGTGGARFEISGVEVINT